MAAVESASNHCQSVTVDMSNSSADPSVSFRFLETKALLSTLALTANSCLRVSGAALLCNLRIVAGESEFSSDKCASCKEETAGSCLVGIQRNLINRRRIKEIQSYSTLGSAKLPLKNLAG